MCVCVCVCVCLRFSGSGGGDGAETFPPRWRQTVNHTVVVVPSAV